MTKLIDPREYNKRIIIFLDVIGMGEFSKKHNKKELIDFYGTVIYRFTQIKQGQFNSPNPAYPFNVDLEEITKNDLVISSLSDSIIISIPFERLILLPILVRHIAILQIICLGKGLPLRGAVTIGEMYHKKEHNIIFGSGLVKAAEEEKNAQYPRVVIDSELCDKHTRLYKNKQRYQTIVSAYETTFPSMSGFYNYFALLKPMINEFIIRDDIANDNRLIIDFIQESTLDLYDKAYKTSYVTKWPKIIQKNKRMNKNKPRNLEKWKYLEQYLQNRNPCTPL